MHVTIYIYICTVCSTESQKFRNYCLGGLQTVHKPNTPARDGVASSRAQTNENEWGIAKKRENKY